MPSARPHRWRKGRVFKRNGKGSWYFVVDIGPRGIPGNQVMRGGFHTKEEALAAMHSLQLAVRAGDYVRNTKLSVREFLIDVWLERKRLEVRDSTWLNFKADIQRILPLIGDLPLQSVTQRILNDAYVRLKEQRGYSASTVRQSHQVLRNAFGQAVEDRLIVRNPTRRAFRLLVAESETPSLTPAEAARLLANRHGTPDYAWIRLLVTQGLRPGELCALRNRDVNLSGGWLIVNRTMSRKVRKPGETGPKIRSEPDAPKTKAGRRRRDLDPETLEALRAYWKVQNATWDAMGEAFQDRGFFFAYADGRPWDPGTLSQRFHRMIRKSNLPAIPCMDCGIRQHPLLQTEKFRSKRSPRCWVKNQFDRHCGTYTWHLHPASGLVGRSLLPLPRLRVASVVISRRSRGLTRLVSKL